MAQWRPGPDQGLNQGPNPNVSPGHPLCEFLQLSLVLALILAALIWASGWLIDFAVARIGPEREMALSRAMASATDELGVDHPRLPTLRAQLAALESCAGLPAPLTLKLIDEDAPNAFAVPGGQIWLSTGLLSMGLDARALDFVLGHELGHFAHRDHLRGLGRQLVLWWVSVAVIGDDSALTGLLAPGLGAGRAGYSRERERAADRFGLDVLHCRHGEVAGATAFFERLGAGGGHGFDTHPGQAERIDALRERARVRQYSVGGG